MEMKKFIADCLVSISKERQLRDAANAAGEHAISNYHDGRMQVWHEVHSNLVRWFDKE